MKKRINYNPSLSISENASKNGVTEDAVRYYIRSHNIDRRKEGQIKIISDCRRLLATEPELSPFQISRKLPYSINTVKKYWNQIVGEQEIELSNIGNKKHQTLTLRQKHNFYATHPACTVDILRVEKFSPSILEPFCGSGSMAEELKRAGYEVAAYDIVDRGYGEVADFQNLEVEIGKYDIISNPPYDSNLIEHVLKCLSVCKSKVALLLPLNYLSGKERHEKLFSIYPPKRIYVYRERITIAIGGDFERVKTAGSNMTNYCWFVWERGHQGTTELLWMKNQKTE